VPKKVEQINDYLFIDTWKSNKIQIGVDEMTVNDSEMNEMKRRNMISAGYISSELDWMNTDYREKEQRTRWVFNFLRKRAVERSETGELIVGGGVTWWAT